jgi:penicillin amidase
MLRLAKMSRQQILAAFAVFFAAIVLPVVIFIAMPELRGVPRLLSVSEGMWQTKLPTLEKRRFHELKAPVDIAFDSQGIPHILAQNKDDLYFAQGLLTASFRLFEMDMSTRVALGRLSELLGSRALEYDRFFVTFGLRQAVREQADFIMKDPEMAPKMTAYLKGVNAYIDQLEYRDLPVEYKILGEWPEKWDATRIASLLKIMTFRLSGRSHDLSLTRILQTLGPEKTQDLFPEFLPANLEAYFVERSGQRKRDLVTTLNSNIHIQQFPSILQVFEGNGSNSWAVGPSKSKTGRSILANDTHLSYQLPSVWFEAQLMTPQMNVYGAGFPGAPGIVLGLNPKLAWGVTNGTSDAIDWSEIEFKDDKSDDYHFDDGFKTAFDFEEKIAVRSEQPVTVHVGKTDFGYVMHRENKYGLAVRWTGHAASSEFKALFMLNEGRSVADCIQALKNWHGPVQNFTCADENNISIFHAGGIPLRKGNEGWVVKQAKGHDSMWDGEIPFEQLPHAVNPPSGFVFSANQRPVGPSYPYYLSWDFEAPFRGQRIRNLLLEKQKLDGNDFIQMQNDILDQHASIALPMLSELIQTKDLSPSEKAAYEILQNWDFLAHGNSSEETIFQSWWKNIEKLLWKDVLVTQKKWIPKKARTIWFFRQLQASPEKWRSWLKTFSSAEELVTVAFRQGISELESQYGIEPKEWLWFKAQKTFFPHVAKIPGLGTDTIEMDGSGYAVMANKGTHGPTWKLVVELGTPPRAWAQLPGGVTGNPLDPSYEKFVGPWSKGEMRPVEFWRDPAEAMANAAYVWRWEAK